MTEQEVTKRKLYSAVFKDFFAPISEENERLVKEYLRKEIELKLKHRREFATKKEELRSAFSMVDDLTVKTGRHLVDLLNQGDEDILNANLKFAT